MEEPISSTESADVGSLSAHELLILHTADSHEWATYLQEVLKASKKFRKRSILPYTVSPAGQLHGCDFECFQSCRCIVLLLMGELLDMLGDPDLQRALQTLLYPPHRVVALMSSVSEDSVPMEIFEDWPSWRKLSAEDEPAVYISTILESLTDSRLMEAEHKSEAAATAELHNTATENPTSDQKGEVMSAAVKETDWKNGEPVSTGNSNIHLTCLTVQPSRVLCGEQNTLFIIFTHKIDNQSGPEVEFSSENEAAKRVPGTVENEYTISVTAPDMPAGVASLTMFTDQSCVSLRPVTYYTNMGEVSRYLENATNPVSFICQAFNLTSNSIESVDMMLADSLKSRMPATSLQLFGVRQIEEENMAVYQRTVELPTLLHFAAKYGLKKLTTILLQCPGALQAYSVMNKHGDYPNTLAEKSGFSDLRQFMDDFVETADMLKSHFADSINPEEDAEVYELMSATTQDIMMKYSTYSEDVYVSMLEINPECADDLYEVMSAVVENPEEVMLRKFFQGKPHVSVNLSNNEHLKSGGAEKDDHDDLNQTEEEYPCIHCPEDVYDTVDDYSTYNTFILNRPPAPMPRPEPGHEGPVIFRVFSNKGTPDGSTTMEMGYRTVRPVLHTSSSVYDPYAGMKTPGQRQLISLQERVKVGEITVDDAVQEFQAWKLHHEERGNSMRYQQENLKRLRDSITRRHKERQKTGKKLDYEISAPLQRNLNQASSVTFECSVYEPIPSVVAPPPPPPPPAPPGAQIIQRGGWKTGSTSSTSSSDSNRLSTHSTFSSGTEPDFEDIESLAPPPRPPRSSDAAALISPPWIPPRVPERAAEKKLHERYISCPTRALPQIPAQRHTHSAPPVPRRLR